MRTLATWLIERAHRTLPPSKQQWADAMLGELHHIENDRHALRWAFGCWIAALVEGIRVLPPLELLPVRLFVVLLFVQQVFNDFFASVLTLAYQTHSLQLAERLGRLTPGHDYRPLIPLMNTVPVWLHAMYVTGALLYLTAGVRYVRRSSSTVTPFAAAFVIDAVAWCLLQPYLTATGAVGDPVASSAFGVALELSIAAFLWIVLLKRDSTPHASDSAQ
jgi:hypothetical protein